MMKKILLTLGLIAGCLYTNAGDKFNYNGFSFETLDNETCQTSPRTSGDRGPNQGTSNAKTEIPSKVTYNGKEYTVTKIGDYSFASNRNNSQGLTLPSTIKEIGAGAFYNWDNYDTLVIPNGVEIIGEYAFYGNNNIGKQCQESNHAACGKSLIIPGSVNVISDYAFGNCNIECVVIEEGVQRICPKAFSGNTNIKHLFIPGTVKTIEEGTFPNQTNLKILSLGHGIETIGKDAFSNCGLNELVIPGSVSVIKEGAFRDCNRLDHLKFEECKMEDNCGHQGLKEIEAYAFYGCSALKDTLRLPDSLEIIGDYAFYNSCSGGMLIIGKNLKKVGKYGMWLWKNDKSSYIEFPATLTDIEEFAFNLQTMINTLTDFYYPNGNPGPINEDAFGSANPKSWVYKHVCLHVPVGTAELYKSLPGWRNFDCIIDDLIPENTTPDEDPVEHTDPQDPLTYILDYIYLVPGDESINLSAYLGEPENSEQPLVWKAVDNEVLTIDTNGNVTPHSFGSHIAVAKRTGIYRVDDGGNRKPYADVTAGAVVIFVCPTITVVYDKGNLTDGDPIPNLVPPTYAPRRAAAEDDNSETPETPETLMSQNTTYTHYVLPTSFPKVQVNPVSSITIDVIERGSMDNYNNIVDGDGLETIYESTNQNEGGLYDPTGNNEGVAGALLPTDPIEENRIIALSLTMALNVATDVDTIEVNNKISIVTNQHMLKIVGADADSMVDIANLEGMSIYHGTDKEIELEPGIYIIRVEDVVFKAIVK